jgi:EAL and modified HD-GYP domain-containing signal transduction protein
VNNICKEGVFLKYFVSTIPFFDASMTVHAYRMVTQDGGKLLGTAEDFRELGGDLMAPALEIVGDIGIEPFAGKNDLFVELSLYQLLMTMPINMKIPTENFVCIVSNSVLEDNAAHSKLMLLKRRGYRLAIEGFPRKISIDTAIKVFDYILLDCTDTGFQNDFKNIRPYIFNTKLVITNIPDMYTFDKYSGARGVLLSGGFYSQPVTKGVSDISPLKINALNLLREINNESFELSEAAEIIERDPALTISLLRFINAMNPNRSRKINSIRNAVTILGQNEVKRWATVAISMGVGEDRPNELTRLSIVRAKFAENLAPAFEMALLSGTLFIAGLFSLLDLILQRPIREAIDEVAADDEIKDALVNKRGRIYEVLSLIFAYDRADWHTASLIMVRNNIDIEVLSQAYLDSIIWYRQLLESINNDEEEIGSE